MYLHYVVTISSNGLYSIKNIKSYLILKMKEERLNTLTILNIENDSTTKLEYNNVTNIMLPLDIIFPNVPMTINYVNS